MDQYIKAVPLTDSKSVVYACQFTEDKYHFVDGSISGGKMYLMRMYNDTVAITPNTWLVWFPDVNKYDFISDDEFRDRFVLYDDLPPDIKAMADLKPCFEDWIAYVNFINEESE